MRFITSMVSVSGRVLAASGRPGTPITNLGFYTDGLWVADCSSGMPNNARWQQTYSDIGRAIRLRWQTRGWSAGFNGAWAGCHEPVAGFTSRVVGTVGSSQSRLDR